MKQVDSFSDGALLGVDVTWQENTTHNGTEKGSDTYFRSNSNMWWVVGLRMWPIARIREKKIWWFRVKGLGFFHFHLVKETAMPVQNCRAIKEALFTAKDMYRIASLGSWMEAGMQTI